MQRRESLVLFKVHVLGQLTARLLDRLLPPPIRPDELAVFSVIATMGPITPREISRKAGTRPATLTDMIRRFENNGLIVKTANPEDGRSYLVSLSRSGKDTWRETQPALVKAISAVEDQLGESLDSVVGALDDFEAALTVLLESESFEEDIARAKR